MNTSQETRRRNEQARREKAQAAAAEQKNLCGVLKQIANDQQAPAETRLEAVKLLVELQHK